MEQKLSDTLVKVIDRSNPMMQNLQLASRFNKLVEEGGGSADLEDNKEVTITENGEIEIAPTEGKDGMKKVTATVNVASANLTSEELNADEIRTAVENGQAITPPNGVDGFSEITFPSYLMQEEEITTNGTKEFGTNSAPYFPKKVTVNVPSNYTIEEKSFSKSSEPFTLDCSDKSFVYLMTIASNGVGQGITGVVENLTNDFTVSVSSAGSTAGTMTWTARTKTLTYTPNTNFQMGSVRFKLVTI